MLVHKPETLLLTYKGYDIIFRSNNPIEDMAEYDKVLKEFLEKVIEEDEY